MTTEITCPFCHFSKKLPETKIPVNAKWAVCPNCNQKFEISQSNKATRPLAEEGGLNRSLNEVGLKSGEEPIRNGGPWENRSETGFAKGTYRTFKEVLFSPSTFFRGLTFNNGIREPLAFGLLTGAVGNMFGIFWPVLMMSGGLFPFGEAISGHLTVGLIFLIMAVAVPVCVTLSMFIYSAILHLLLLITRGGKNRFEATFRVVAYSQAAQALDLIPVVGSWIGGIWQLIIQVIGLREIHNTSYLRVFMAFLLPVAIIFLLIMLVLVPLLIYLG